MPRLFTCLVDGKLRTLTLVEAVAMNAQFVGTVFPLF